MTPDDVQDLDHLADRYQALYHSTMPAVLMTPVVAHLETLRDFLRQGVSASLRTFSHIRTTALICGFLRQHLDQCWPMITTSATWASKCT